MHIYDAMEQAYKNGFRDGVASTVKLGQWDIRYIGTEFGCGFIHKECGEITFYAHNYCPKCGARMSVETR